MDMSNNVTHREPTADEAAGISWWNGLTSGTRRHWLNVSNSATPADAWTAYKASVASGVLDVRDRWLAEGVPESELDALESLHPLGAWDIQWESHLSKEQRYRLGPNERGPGDFMTRVRCPKCGSEATYSLDAVTDFHCDDEDDCGYDFVDDAQGLVPLPGSF